MNNLSAEEQHLMDCFDRFVAKCKDVMILKHRSYGPKNILRIKAKGVASRMEDKLARIQNFLEKDIVEGADGESLRDAVVDMLNYSCILDIYLNGEWPGQDK